MEKVRIWEHQGLSGSSQVSRELVFDPVGGIESLRPTATRCGC